MRGGNILRFFMRSKILICLLLTIIPLRYFSQEVLSLSKAIAYTEENSYQAQIGKIDIESAKEKISESLSLYYPKIDFSLGHIHLDNDPAFKFGQMVFPAGEQLFWKWDFTVNYTIWDFGRRSKAVESLRKGEKAVSFKAASDIKIKQAEVTALYMQALTLKEQVDVLYQRKKSVEEHLKTAQNLYEQGIVTRNDVLRTEVALRAIDDQIRTLESAKTNVENNLKKSIGMDIDKKVALSSPFNEMGQNKEAMFKIFLSEDEIKQKVLTQNEGLRALQMKIDSLNEILSLQKKDYYPYFVGAVGHSYEQNRYMAYPHLNKLYLGIAFNIFDGGVKKSKISQTKLELEKAMREKNEAEKEIIVKGLEAYMDYLNAVEEYKTAKLNVNSSYENLRIIEDQYKEGLLKTTDYLEAETLYSESRFKEIESLHKIVAVQAKIFAIIGEDLKKYFSQSY